MKILFIYPNITRAKSPQLGLGMISAAAKKSGRQFEMYDPTTIEKGEEFAVFESQLRDFNPDLSAVSCRSNELSFAGELFNEVGVKDSL